MEIIPPRHQQRGPYEIQEEERITNKNVFAGDYAQLWILRVRFHFISLSRNLL